MPDGQPTGVEVDLFLEALDLSHFLFLLLHEVVHVEVLEINFGGLAL